MPLLSRQITIKTIVYYKQVASQLPSIIIPWPASQKTQRTEQTMMQPGQFRYNSVGKWELKKDELLMLFPTPGFQERKRNAVMIKENCHRSAQKKGKVLSMPSNMYSFTSQFSVTKIKNLFNCQKLWCFLCFLLWHHLAISLLTTSHQRGLGNI